MTRQVRDTILDSRSTRRTLKQHLEPYWRALDKGLHLGYRKKANGGSWIVRRFNESRRYIKHRLGTADDYADADGLTTLNYSQAQEAARRWAVAETFKERGVDQGAHTGPYTVTDAMRDYLAQYTTHGRGRLVAESCNSAYILPAAISRMTLDRLSTKQLSEWHHNIANSPAMLRTKKNAKVHNTRPVSDDPEALRRRRSTANRVLGILKASLNLAWREGKCISDNAWRRVKPFKNVHAPIIRYLSEGECKRLVNACPEDLRLLAKAALLTGCRYGELAALKKSDFNPDVGMLTIRISKSGKRRHVVLNDEGQQFFTVAIANKQAEDLIFIHENGTPWKESHQGRPIREACKQANITPAISFHILRHTHGSLLAMQGVPMPVIAQQLGHSDTRMTEKHYAHLSPSYVADTIRQHFPKLGLSEGGNVISLR